MKHIPDHTFFVDCPACHRRLTARTLVVLELLAKSHAKRCFVETKASIDAAKAERAQGKLF